MSADLSDNDLIERFLLGKMSDREARDFKLRMEDDRELARKCRMLQMFPEMMSDAAKAELQANQEAPPPEPPKERSKVNYKPFLIIAGVIALLVAAVFIFLQVRRSGFFEKNTSKTPVAEISRPAPVITRPQPAQPAEKKDTVVKEAPAVETVAVPEKGIHPANGETMLRSDQISFRWKNAIDTFSRISIYSENLKKIILWRGVKPGTTTYEIPANTLHAGTYTWYLGNSAERHSFAVKDTAAK